MHTDTFWPLTRIYFLYYIYYSFIHIVLTVLLTLCQWRKSRNSLRKSANSVGRWVWRNYINLLTHCTTHSELLGAVFLMRQTSCEETSSPCVKTSYQCFSDVVCIRRVRKSVTSGHSRRMIKLRVRWRTQSCPLVIGSVGVDGGSRSEVTLLFRGIEKLTGFVNRVFSPPTLIIITLSFTFYVFLII